MDLRISSLSLSASEKIAKPGLLALFEVENILTLIDLKHLEKVEFLDWKNKLPGKWKL